MHRVKVHDQADHELKAASRSYENRVEGLGEKFLDDIEEAIKISDGLAGLRRRI